MVRNHCSSTARSVGLCHYPSALEELATDEECPMARCHLVGTIPKFRPAGRSSPIAYNAIRGHMIVIPHDPGPLLLILPSPELRLDNGIKVSGWDDGSS
jgi:hypothetical protein